MNRFQDNMRRQRENPDTKRAGLKWDDEEDEKVFTKIKEGTSIDVIAKELFRTPASIKTRVINYVLKLLRTNMTTADREKLLKEYNLTEEDIQQYMEKRKINDEKKQNETLALINKKISNPTIKDVHEINKEILVVVNDIRSMLNKDYLVTSDKLSLFGSNGNSK